MTAKHLSIFIYPGILCLGIPRLVTFLMRLLNIDAFSLLEGKASVMKDDWNFNGGTVGNLTVENLVVEDFCPIRVAHSAYKGIQHQK